MAIEKGLLAFIIISAIGIIVLPNAVSLFAGQHIWYDVSKKGNDIPCQKCHADIYEELNLSAYHKKWGNSLADTADCEACHRGNASITYANGSSDQPGKEAHAASTINCGYCHFNSSNPYNAPVAGGFGLSDYATNPGNDTGEKASHYAFVIRSKDSDILQGESESCVACHTTTGVKIHFNVTTEIKVVANNTFSAQRSYWNVASITPSNYTTYEEVKR